MKKILVTFTILFTPLFALAQGYTPIVGIPGVSAGNFDQYINSIYALSISLAALLAVIKIIIAGVKWMMTDVVTNKSDAKADIRGALLGLLVILSAVLILTLINDDITNVQLTGAGGTVATQNPTTPVTGPAIGGYTVNSANGYTWIDYQTDFANRNDFETNCEADGNTLYWAADAQQIRCIAPTAAQNTTIRGYAPTGSNFSTTEQDLFVESYVEFITPGEVNSATLTNIETALEAERGEDWDVFFAVDQAVSTTLEETQFEGVCEDVDQAQEANGYIGEVQITTGGASYLVCARLNQ